MCTAINFNGYFGRTLDYEHGFGEVAVTLSRGSELALRHRKTLVTRYSIVGMARIEEGFPLFFDAMNERGLAMAGLNFVGNAYFPHGEKGDVAVFELIPYVLSQAETVEEAERLILETRVVDTPFSKNFPTASLHWMIGDADSTIVVESTEDGLRVYTNPVGVLTNNPPFPFQLEYLNNFLGLSALPAVNRFSNELELSAVSRGMGAVGLPGDWSSSSRFVRASFVRENAVKEGGVAHLFRMMASIAVPKGCMVLEGGECEYTRYTACMDLKNGVYYYSTYDEIAPRCVTLV